MAFSNPDTKIMGSEEMQAQIDQRIIGETKVPL